MITADELAEIRKSGANDADILEKYKQFDPQSASDIDELQKSGAHPAKILDKLVQFHAQGGGDQSPADPMADKGIIEKAAGALQYGAANELQGISRTAARTGHDDAGANLQGAAGAVAPHDYDPASNHLTWNPKTWGYAPRALLESSPGMATDLTAGELGAAGGAALGSAVPIVGTAAGGVLGGLGGFGASYFARNYGANLDSRMENQPKGAEPSAADKAIAGGSTLAEGALNKLGLGGAIGGTVTGAGVKALAKVPLAVLGRGAAEGAAGATGDVINQVGRTAGTQEGLNVNPEEVANVGTLAGMTGAGLRAARGAGDVTNAVRFKDMDQEAASRFAGRMSDTEVNPKSGQKAYEAVDKARSRLDTDIDTFKSDGLAPLRGDNDALSLVNGVIKDLKSNKTVTTDDLNAVKAHLADTQEGQQLHDLLAERQAANQLTDKGVFKKDGDDPKGYFAGGVTASQLGRSVINPLGLVKNRAAQLMAGTGVSAGIAGLPIAAQLATHASTAGYLLGGQLGLYGGLRAADSALGLRNPAKEFMNRFGGLPQGDGASAPSWRGQAADAQATQQQATADARGNAQANTIAQGLAKSALQNTVAQGKALGTQQAQADRQANTVTQGLAKSALKNTIQQGNAQAAQDAKNQTQANTVTQGLAKSALQNTVLQGKALGKAQADAETLRTKQEDAAWRAKDAMGVQDAKASQARDADFDKAQAQLSKPTPEMVKAQQEDAAWRSQQPSQDDSWNDMDALAAIQKELASRDKASQAIVKLSKPAQAAQDAAKPAKSTNGSAKAPKGASEPASDPDTITIQHGNQTVTRPKDSIRNIPAYVTKTKARMADRQSFADDLEKAVGSEYAPHIETMLNKLNNGAHTWDDAYYHVEDLVNDLPEELRSKAMDVLMDHRPKVAGSYGN